MANVLVACNAQRGAPPREDAERAVAVLAEAASERATTGDRPDARASALALDRLVSADVALAAERGALLDALSRCWALARGASVAGPPAPLPDRAPPHLPWPRLLSPDPVRGSARAHLAVAVWLVRHALAGAGGYGGGESEGRASDQLVADTLGVLASWGYPPSSRDILYAPACAARYHRIDSAVRAALAGGRATP